MTREEAIAILNHNVSACLHGTEWGEALDMAIKALEQEPVIDKIRAEIDKIYEREGNSVDCLNVLDELKWFIDKCKADIEPQESEEV